MRGSKIADPIALADWYTTFAALAGVDPTDHSAATAGLPPIDGAFRQRVLYCAFMEPLFRRT
jgi:hypothetical protein